jgi:outer membrane lipoprotein-sorting protein
VLAATLSLGLAAAAAGGAGDSSGAPAREASGDAGLVELMAAFASAGGVRARFRETKHLALLEEPLETEGVVVFAPPDRLARHTTRPGRSSVVAHGGHVVIRDETGRQELELGEDDPARQLVDNLAVLLRGDLEALRARYSVQFQRDGDGWQLELEPRSRLLRRIVASIRSQGQGAELHRMEMLEPNGDSTVTTFFDVETGLVFAPGEIETLFSAEDPAPAP